MYVCGMRLGGERKFSRRHRPRVHDVTESRVIRRDDSAALVGGVRISGGIASGKVGRCLGWWKF